MVIIKSHVNRINPLGRTPENKQNQGTDLFISVVTADQIGENFVTYLIINLG